MGSKYESGIQRREYMQIVEVVVVCTETSDLRPCCCCCCSFDVHSTLPETTSLSFRLRIFEMQIRIGVLMNHVTNETGDPYPQ